MVTKSINENIFNSDIKHIAFAINKEGYNDAGFAGTVSSKYWSELEKCGEHEIGTVLSKQVGDKTFHALVCHSLEDGWGENQRETIKKCFNNIPTDEPIASIAIGTGLIGTLSGADFAQIVCGMHDSDKFIELHSVYSLDSIIDFYNKNTEIEYSFLENGILDLDAAIKVLKDFRKKGMNNIYADFNGHRLYSKDINTHKAYMLVTGMSKKDCLLKMKMEAQKIEKEIEERYQYAIENLPKVIEEGKKYIYEEKYDLWEKYCEADCNGMYHLYNIESTLEIMEFVSNGGSIEEVEKILRNQGHSGYSIGLTLNTIANFCKKGTEIYRLIKADEITDEAKARIEEIEKENEIYEAKLKLISDSTKETTRKLV